MEDYSKFENICPYNDEEASAALTRIAENPFVKMLSKKCFPGKEPLFLTKKLKKIKSIQEFQETIISQLVGWVIQQSMDDFTYDGIQNIPTDKKFVLMSNHRDIILDPALTQCVFMKNNIPATEICVGDNLLQNELITELIRSNRMIKVLRGLPTREMYLSSQLLSEYIRLEVTSNKSSVWIAQRQGRTKDGIDITEQGLLRMMDLSGKNDFITNYEELNIIPMSISYEYEPCAIQKAQEILVSRTEKYVKKPGEDINSILTGLKQYKGRVHISFGMPLTHQEIYSASLCEKNDRYQWIRHCIDLRIVQSYRLFKTNYIAYDILAGGNKYAEFYTAEDVAEFNEYLTTEIMSAERQELDKNELRNIMLSIYANPVISKESILLQSFNVEEIKYF